MLLLGGGLAFWNVSRSSGGASSPQAAVQRLVDAIADEDPLGVVAAMDPDEANVLREMYKTASAQAENEGFIAGKKPLAGIDLTATNMRYTVTNLSDDVASVNVTDGTIGYSFNPGALTGKTRDALEEGDGDAVRSQSDSASIADLLSESDGASPGIVAVKRGGGWYVSALYTAAEAIRTINDAPSPDYSAGAPGKGASSPKGVIEELIRSVGNIDIEGGLQLLDPESLRVLADYRSSILAEVNDRDVASARDNFNLVLDTLEVKTHKLDGAHTRVDITRLEGHGSATHEQDQYSTDSRGYSRYTGTEEVTDTASVSLSGTCITVNGEFNDEPSQERSCLSDSGYTFGIDAFFIVVVERDGSFYLDPLRTIAEYIRIAAESDDIEKAVCDATDRCAA